MTRQQHGLFSLGLLVLAVLIGTMGIIQFSVYTGLVYIGLSIISALIIVCSFCSKCPCRETDCGHVLPGRLTKFLPERKVGRYTPVDLAGVIIPLLFLVIFPQFWLRHSISLMTAFLLLLIIAVIDITIKVCKGCGNKHCPVNSRTK